MPQLNKGGKFVFGLSIIGNQNKIQIPEQAILEYSITKDDNIIIFTGAKATGGFCITSHALLSNSKLKHILDDCPALACCQLQEGSFIRYKGRGYSWLTISPSGVIQLPAQTMKYLNLSVGDTLMSIRSSDIAFTMGAKGPLMEKIHSYTGTITEYRIIDKENSYDQS